jgi:AP-3 complex subunit mu
MLHIDALVDALAKAARPSDVDPVLYVPAHNLDGPTACCHMQVGGMRFLCPISGDREFPCWFGVMVDNKLATVDPVYAFSFLQTFIDILTEYFGSVTAPTLRDNFDVIYQVYNMVKLTRLQFGLTIYLVA